MLDLAVKNGYVLDGTGNPWFRADIEVRNGKIAKVGHFTENADTLLNAKGLTVCPASLTCTLTRTTHYSSTPELRARYVRE